jgi:hypothetical protein
MYISRFVAPWARDGDADSTLARVMQTDRSQLVAAMSAFVEAMRTGLFASTYWKDVGRDRTIESLHQGLGTLLRAQAPGPAAARISLDIARRDARTGSRDLLEWRRDTAGHTIERPELVRLLQRVRTEPRGRTLLIGEAGAGKSAILSELTDTLQREGVIVFGLKADMIPPETRTIADLSTYLGLGGDLNEELDVLAQSGPVVLVIDQLDAVSDIMDRTSQRMRLLLELAKRFGIDGRREAGPPVHVIVSSRPFEAAHDARFQTLHAEEMKLALPAPEAVDDLLRAVGLNPKDTPPGLKETIRRPFALRLFVELVQGGVDVRAITPGELLHAWLMDRLKDATERPRVIAFLERLAAEMTETESLWRPADIHDERDGDKLAIAEAAGLVIRQNGRLGFSHQSWLDDFQARAFRTAANLAAFAWARQDGLFVRGTVLRALERLRRHDPDQYDAALDLFLHDPQTRRHLRHLVVDIVAAQVAPRPREVAWVDHILRNDTALARRAFGKVSQAWGAWRAGLRLTLPVLMASPELKWGAATLLQAEARLPDSEAQSLLDRHWTSNDDDLLAFDVISRAPLWSPSIRDRVAAIMARQDIADYAISHFIDRLIETGRPEDAAEVVATWLAARPAVGRGHIRIHSVHRLSELAPLAVARALTPWFLSRVQPDEDSSKRAAGYVQARSLPYHWEDDEREDSVFHLYRASMATTAREAPDEARALLTQFLPVESEEAQILVADTYAAAPAAFAREALGFLRSDPRRLDIGETSYEDGTGCSHTLYGFASQELVGSIAPHLDADDAGELEALIGRWTRYPDDLWPEDGAKGRRDRRKWSDEARMELYARLPLDTLNPRLRRRVKEKLASQGKRTFGRMMAHFVGAPMSTEQMGKAGDDDVMRLLDECADGTQWGDNRRTASRHISQSGGAIQASRTFANLAKVDPERVIGLIETRLTADKHQIHAGAAVHELSEVEAIEPTRISALVHTLSSRGFDSDDFRTHAAWGLERVAHRGPGLTDQDLALLESWIVDDAALVAETRSRRTMQEEASLMRTALPQREARPVEAVLFGRSGGGILPQDNYAYLSAIGAGLLGRTPVDVEGWLDVLERHAPRAEYPEVWRAVLTYWGHYLFWADRPRAQALLAAIWAAVPEAFDLQVVARLFAYRAMIPSTVEAELLTTWLVSDDLRLQQAAGEYLGATFALGDEGDVLGTLIAAVRDGNPCPARTGLLFGSAAVWRGQLGEMRERAHHILRRFAPNATGDEAKAIATALNGDRTLTPDSSTLELLELSMANGNVLLAASGHWFSSALQDLLLSIGFDEVVLQVGERTVDLLSARDPGGMRHNDQDLVSIAIALQRTDGVLRPRAMTLYERLLDANVYGAEQAAADSLRN